MCSISIFCTPASKNACACGDLVEMCMPVGESCATACSPQNRKNEVAKTRNLVDDILDSFCCCCRRLQWRARQAWLVAFEKISLLQRELAVNFQDVDAARDGINVDQPDRAGNGFHRFQKLFF